MKQRRAVPRARRIDVDISGERSDDCFALGNEDVHQHPEGYGGLMLEKAFDQVLLPEEGCIGEHRDSPFFHAIWMSHEKIRISAAFDSLFDQLKFTIFAGVEQ